MEFKTSAEENAGTDANVYFQMIGEDGETQEIDLKNKGKGYFHRGQLDRFRIRARDVGRVSENCCICTAILQQCNVVRSPHSVYPVRELEPANVSLCTVSI